MKNLPFSALPLRPAHSSAALRRWSAGLALATLGLASPMSAATIILDTFAGTGSIIGQAPEIAQTPGDVWSGGGSGLNEASGYLDIGSGSFFAYATLPMTIGTGVYQLSADINVTGPGAGGDTSNWLTMGFASSDTLPSFFTGASAPWFLTRQNGGGVAFGSGTSSSFADWDGAPLAASTHSYLLELDTTGANWVAELFIDGNSYGTLTYTTNPTVSHVYVGRYGMSGTIENLEVNVVPEPAAGLLALSSVGVMVLRVRRRAHSCEGPTGC